MMISNIKSKKFKNKSNKFVKKKLSWSFTKMKSKHNKRQLNF